ncbi:uncharacterized protein [Haliotis cracherodii]|uniref:uncharacterized protein n=1 Tax=Haliotis cracherodii TaxID=6455 RepID=UPI0039ED2CE4
MHYIVKFLKSDEIGLIPDTWLEGDRFCYWPKYKNSNQMDRAVKSSVEPDKDTWKIYEISIMYKNASYDKARRKLPLAEETSNLDTEMEEEGQIDTRKRRPPTKYLSSDSEDEEERQPYTHTKKTKIMERSGMVSRLPTPPRVPTEVDIEPLVLRRSPRKSAHQREHVTSNSSLTASTTDRSLSSPWPSATRARLVTPSNSSYSPMPDFPSTPARPQTSFQSRTTGSLTSVGTSREVVQIIRAIETNTATTMENNRLLNQLLLLMSAPAQSTSEQPSLDLPLDNIQDLEEANTSLSDATLFRSVVSQLGVIGGMSAADTVRRILSAAITNKLAKQINWKGTSGKRAFKDMPLKDVIIKATRKNPLVQKTNNEIEDHIKLWFRYAPDRDGGRKERILKALQKKAAATAAAPATPNGE